MPNVFWMRKANNGGFSANGVGMFSRTSLWRFCVFELNVIISGVLMLRVFLCILSLFDLVICSIDLNFSFIVFIGYVLFLRLCAKLDVCASSALGVEQFLMCLSSWDFGILLIVDCGWLEFASRYWKLSVGL